MTRRDRILKELGAIARFGANSSVFAFASWLLGLLLRLHRLEEWAGSGIVAFTVCVCQRFSCQFTSLWE